MRACVSTLVCLAKVFSVPVMNNSELHEQPIDHQCDQSKRNDRERQRYDMDNRLDGSVDKRHEQGERRDAKHRGLANGVHAGQNRNHNARRDGKN